MPGDSVGADRSRRSRFHNKPGVASHGGPAPCVSLELVRWRQLGPLLIVAVLFRALKNRDHRERSAPEFSHAC
jgi:hypothetical protein